MQTAQATDYGIWPDIVLWGTLAVLGGWSLYVASFPLADFLTAVFLTPLWIVFALTWIGAGIVTLRSPHRRRRVISRWIGVPIVVIVLVAAYSTGLPDRSRFWLSRAALNHAADRVERGEAVSGNVGHYTVAESSRVGDAAVLFLVDRDFSGSLYLTRNSPPEAREFCERLDRHWRLCTVGA